MLAYFGSSNLSDKAAEVRRLICAAGLPEKSQPLAIVEHPSGSIDLYILNGKKLFDQAFLDAMRGVSELRVIGAAIDGAFTLVAVVIE